MSLSTNSKYAFAVVIGVIVASASVFLLMNPAQEPAKEIEVRLLLNAGVMIEANGVRIYVDPLYIPSNYTDLPADVVLITHPHTDHYSVSDLNDIVTNDTLFVCPANMTDAIDRFDGVGVNPGDSFLVEGINITAFPLYLPDYPSGVQSVHPESANWTSFIIDIDGFTIYHAGDNKYIDEYEELVGSIDLAFLPIYFDGGLGDLNASLYPIVQSINVIQPTYTIPTHFAGDNRETFLSEYSILVENPTNEILDVPYFTFLTFTSEGTLIQSP
ncbi:MAG: MBL fold metallo-hydrolase [Candidatus Thorarchaeota archaeon]